MSEEGIGECIREIPIDLYRLSTSTSNMSPVFLAVPMLSVSHHLQSPSGPAPLQSKA